MTIHLPDELERSIRDRVRSGQFASADELIVQAVRSFLERPDGSALGSIGMMRDAADELDEVVADAYRRRGLSSWSGSSGTR